MKRQLSMLALICLFGLPAVASDAGLARSWAAEAGSLHEALSDLPTHDLPSDLESRLVRFGRISGRLAVSGDEDAPVPADLVCIFNGMAAETSNQLTALDEAESQADTDTAFERLMIMLVDAEDVGEAAALAMEDASGATDHAALPGQCEAGTLPKTR